MNRRSVVLKLRRAIGSEGQALLGSFNLLQPLVKQMLICEAMADVLVSQEQLQHAQISFLHQHGYQQMEQWPELLETLGLSEEGVLERLRHDIRRRSLMRERFAAKAEARFLERKNDLDHVVYSLLRLKNSFLARELYLQIESGEANFADLARRYAEGPERSTNGIVGPLPLPRPILPWLRSYGSLNLACCLNPFKFPTGGSWFVLSVTHPPRSPMRSQTGCARKCLMPGLTRKPPRAWLSCLPR